MCVRGEERNFFVFLYYFQVPTVPRSYVHSVSLPIYCTYSTHPQTQGCMKDVVISPSVLFPSSTTSFSLSFLLCLALTHTPLCVFLINFAVNQITPLCNKLQTSGIEEGSSGWRWKRRRGELVVVMSGCRDLICGWMINYSGMKHEQSLDNTCVDARCIHILGQARTAYMHARAQYREPQKTFQIWGIFHILELKWQMSRNPLKVRQSLEDIMNMTSAEWLFDALICSKSEQEIIVG